MELAQQLDQPQVLLSALIGLFSSRFVQGETALSFRIAERALALAPVSYTHLTLPTT